MTTQHFLSICASTPVIPVGEAEGDLVLNVVMEEGGVLYNTLFLGTLSLWNGLITEGSIKVRGREVGI